MGAFWGVTKGSDDPPALIVMTYEPKNGPAHSGTGPGRKRHYLRHRRHLHQPADGMEKMKYDMAGAAAMLGAMQAIAQLKPAVTRDRHRLCRGEYAIRNGQETRRRADAMSGKTIEVINTDAEGRLVLADGLAYARTLVATRLIDAATLTGAFGVALGPVNAGRLLERRRDPRAVSRPPLQVSGERFWRLPVDDDYRDQIKSSIADIMNTGGSRWGGAIAGAMFLKEFVEDTPWIHLDIAGVAWVDEPKPWMSKGPTRHRGAHHHRMGPHLREVDLFGHPRKFYDGKLTEGKL